MADKTKIDWCDASWNPITGCEHGCEYCYARRIANRYGTKSKCHSYEGNVSFVGPHVLENPAIDSETGRVSPYPFDFEPTFHRYRLDIPSRWQRPRTIFVCSMADLFGDWVPDEWIQEVFEACRKAPQHRYLYLTKNPKRYSELLTEYTPGNMWFGWSQTGPIGDQVIFETHHSVNSFVSIEPLLQPFHSFYIRGIGWAIVGAETGNRANKVIPEKSWIMDISDACREMGIPLFMKGSLREIMGEDFRQEYPW